MKTLKKLFGPIAALVALLVFAFTRSHDDKEELETAQETATEARKDAIKADGELEKERIHHEHDVAVAEIKREGEVEVADIADDSIDDIFERAKQRTGSKLDGEG